MNSRQHRKNNNDDLKCQHRHSFFRLDSHHCVFATRQSEATSERMLQRESGEDKPQYYRYNRRSLTTQIVAVVAL
jgi:hypothetical protein